MKLVTFRSQGDAVDRVGAITGSEIVELNKPDGGYWTSMLELIEGGPAAWDHAKLVAEEKSGRCHTLSDSELRAPIPVPPQFRDAMVFHKHIKQSFTAGAILGARMSGDTAAIAAAEEQAQSFEIPGVHTQQPVYYKGNRFATGHPEQTIVWPAYSQLMDFELELACVIGKGGKNISKEDARGHIFGFTILNDLSARDAQGVEMQGMLGPAKGKDFDHANVFGPAIVTLDELGDPYDLSMTARVNDKLWCAGNTAEMFWTFEELIAHISTEETIYPGEIIGSGTVGGGCGLEHFRFLNDGDIVELEITNIGILKNKIVR